MTQETFLKKIQYYADKISYLTKITLESRVRSLVYQGKKIENLGGTSDIPWRGLERMLGGLGYTPSNDSYGFLTYCWKNKLEVTYDSEENGDTLRGFHTSYSNFRLQFKKQD